MTHTTDQERAEFEKWWSSPHIWGRGHKEAQWASWQAARRAPAVPVPHDVVRDACARMCDARAESLQAGNMFTAANEAFKCAMAIRTHPAYQHHLRAAMLAAAPQPPEAEPVRMPEPVAYLHECGKKLSLRTLEFSKVAIQLSAKGYKSHGLFTEQQVRQLLAAHGIQEQST